jgi:hypothetical protein
MAGSDSTLEVSPRNSTSKLSGNLSGARDSHITRRHVLAKCLHLLLQDCFVLVAPKKRIESSLRLSI